MPNYTYTHFIHENIAPSGAKRIGVYNDKGNKVCTIPLGNLAPVQKTKLYSFAAIADVHIPSNTAVADLQNALTFVENSDCTFTCIAGDLTNGGTDAQLKTFQNTAANYVKPIYAIPGNHEATSGAIPFDRMTSYTGYPLYYSFGVRSDGTCEEMDVGARVDDGDAGGDDGDYGPIRGKTYGDSVKDVFIMVGHYKWTQKPFSLRELQWLSDTLERNKDKRCFVFTHVFPWGGAGNALGKYTENIWSGTRGTEFENLMKHYKNVTLFHGHSHFKLEYQEADKTANYSSAQGYRSIHIPSISVPRDILTDGTNNGDNYIADEPESEGYIVDVYDDCIVLNGRDFIDNDKNGHWIGIATYKIDTT